MSLQERLALADRLILLGENDILRYRHIVARLERDGRDTAKARHVLEIFEYIQAERRAVRNELLAAVALRGMKIEVADATFLASDAATR